MATRGNPAAQRAMGRIIGMIGARSRPALVHATTCNDRERNWFPNVEVARERGAIVVTADLPGCSRKDVSVNISSEHLVIEGTQLPVADNSSDGCQRRTRGEPFKRTIVLPDGVDTRRASARFNEGVLEISIPLTTSAGVSRPLTLG